MLQSRQSAGADRAGHNVKLSLKPSTVLDTQLATPWESLINRSLLGRIRRKRTLVPPLKLLHSGQGIGVESPVQKNKTSLFFSFALSPNCLHIK